MKKYLSILLVFIFLFTINFNIYNETKVYASLIDSTYAKGVMTVLNMLVAGGLVTFNNANNAKALAIKLWDSASDSFKTAINNANNLKTAFFTYEVGTWSELINNLKNWYNRTFTVPYSFNIGSSYIQDASVSYDTKSVIDTFTYYDKYLQLPFNCTLYFFLSDGSTGYITFKGSSANYHYDYVNGSTDGGTLTYVNRDNGINKIYIETIVGSNSYKRSYLYLNDYDGLRSRYCVGPLDTGMAMFLSDSSEFSTVDSSLTYDGTGISIGEDVLNLESDTLAGNVADTNVKVPTYNGTLSVDANINSVLDSLIGVDANTYANSFSQTNILSNILNAVSSISTTLTDGLVGDVSRVNFEPLKVSASAITKNFPFSLPWDLYNSVNAVVASGSIPDIDLIFYDPVNKTVMHNNINIGEEFPAVVQLAPFIRSAFLFGFAISLIFATRRLLGGAE